MVSCVRRRGCCVEDLSWDILEQHLVQILVVVAIKQMRTLLAVENNVTFGSALLKGLLGPKIYGKSLQICARTQVERE